MVLLHLLKDLESHGFGTIDTDLFWEDMPLDEKGNAVEGVWIVSRALPATRFSITVQAFDIYARYANKLLTAQKLEAILEYLQTSFSVACTLPPVLPYSDNQYYDVVITPSATVENVGTDENGKIVKVISGEIRYKKLIEES